MQTKTTFKLLGAMLISLILTACGGGDGSALDNTLNGRSSSNGSSVSSAIGADTLQSLEFKDATPSVINLKGTGGAESALVRFRTLGQTGLPISNITVNFSLTSEVGGLALSQTSAVSDKDGYISTSVNSGNISTSIRVTATIKDNPSISTQSNQLVIATGLPDQKSMSIALEKFNPAGWNYIGVTSKVSVLLADAYNNPTADGTTVYFTTEGGSIQPSCTTVGGGCQVLWTSQDPRPPRNSTDNSINRILCLGSFTAPDSLHTCEAERAGRSTILATAIGNESFKDTNGNGVFDSDVDMFVAPSFFIDKNGNGIFDTGIDELVSAKEPRPTGALETDECKPNVPRSSFESSTRQCDDLGEAYLDSNESGTYDIGEYFVDFLVDKTHTQRNGIYNGAFCPEGADPKICSRAPITIRKQHLVIMSCNTPLLDSDGFLPAISGPYTHAVADCNGNPLPLGSTITVGTNPAIKIGNQYDWTPIIAPSGTAVKLTIAIEGGSIDMIVTAK